MSQNLVFPANPQNPFTTAPGCAKIYKLSARTAHGPIAQLGERVGRFAHVFCSGKVQLLLFWPVIHELGFRPLYGPVAQLG